MLQSVISKHFSKMMLILSVGENVSKAFLVNRLH